MFAGRIFLQCLLHFVGQIGTLAGQILLLVHLRQYLGRFPQGSHSKEVGRDKERQRRGVVRRTESRNNQPHRSGRRSPTVVDGSIGGTLGLALEAVRTFVLLALLLLESAQHVLNRLQPVFVENTGIARHLPVMIGQAQRIAQGINLPFAFVQFGLHGRTVGFPLTALRPVVEGIGIRIKIDAQELTADYSFEHLLQFRVLVGKLNVGPHLRTRIAQPHGMNVTRIDKGIGLTVQHTEMYRRVQCVRETVFEHPGQIGIFQESLYLGNLLLNDIRLKQPVFLRRTLADVTAHVVFGRRKGDLRKLFQTGKHSAASLGCSSPRRHSRQNQDSSP